jgi:hypothetical protein
MKKMIFLFLCVLIIVAALSECVSGSTDVYTPLKPSFKTLTTDEKPLPADFVISGSKCWFNDRKDSVAENILTWAKVEGSARCLMLLIDTLHDGAANKSLYIPKYGLPAIGRMRSDINITWSNPADPDDKIALAFPIDSKEMWVLENSLKGKKEIYKVDLPVATYDSDGEWALYYVPLYAILNEVGGGVMYDPFGDGVAFIYTGGALKGYSGVWKVPDNSEYRINVDVEGKTVSVANYWWALELHPDGTFTEIDRHFKDEGGWFRTEYKGQYAFFGRILAMKYTSESVYFGEDFHNLHPFKVDSPFEGLWNSMDGVDVYAKYVDDWSKADVLYIRGSRELYSKELSGRKWK